MCAGLRLAETSVAVSSRAECRYKRTYYTEEYRVISSSKWRLGGEFWVHVHIIMKPLSILHRELGSLQVDDASSH